MQLVELILIKSNPYGSGFHAYIYTYMKKLEMEREELYDKDDEKAKMHEVKPQNDI